MYIANHYVRINGKMYMKGECIPDVLQPEKLERLLELGAVHETVPEVALAEPNKKAKAAKARTEPAEPDHAPEEPDEDEEAPEIDVMAGIVQPEENAEPVAGKSRSGKRAAGRRGTE